MATLQHHYLQRIRAAEQAKLNRELKELAEADARAKRQQHISDVADFVVGVFSGIGMSVMAWIIIWQWWTA